VGSSPWSSYHSAWNDTKLKVLGSGLADATMRVSAKARHIVDATSFVVAPDTLAHVGKLRFHAVDVTFSHDLDEEPLDLDVWLPIARIHRPSRDGCKSTYMVTNESIATYDAQFSVGPVFGKATAKFKAHLGKTYGASATCKEARIRAKLMIIPGTIVVGGQPVASGTINRIHSVSKDWDYLDLSPKFDWCGWDENKIRDPNPTIRDLSGATGGIDDAEVDQLIIAREISGTLGVGVEIRKVPASVSVAFTRTCAESVALTTTLMPGAKYIGYLPRPGNPLEKCWTVAKS